MTVHSPTFATKKDGRIGKVRHQKGGEVRGGSELKGRKVRRDLHLKGNRPLRKPGSKK